MKKHLLIVSCLLVGGLSAQTVSTFPFIEDFEAQPTGPTGCGPAYDFAGTATGWENGLQAIPASTGHDVNWTVDVGGTGSGGTGPSVDHTLGTNAGHYIYAETSCSGTGYTNSDFHLVSPNLDLTSENGLELNFWYHAFGATMGNLFIEVDTNGLDTWTQVGPTITDNIDLWQEATVSLNAYSGHDSVRVRFRYVSGTSFTGDMGLDDITLSVPAPYDLDYVSLDTLPAAACGLGLDTLCATFIHTGIDTMQIGDSVLVNYVDGTTTINDLLILASPVLPGDTIKHIFSAPADFSIAGTYNITSWISFSLDSNATNDTLFANVQSLMTNFITAGVPYVDHFEAAQTWTIDNTTNGAANGTWGWGTPVGAVINSAASDTTAYMTGNLGTGTYGANENSWITSPCFDFTASAGDEWVAMNVWWNSENSWDGANIQYSTDGTTWNLMGNFGDPFNWYTDNTINGTPGGSQEGWTGRTSSGNGSDGWVIAKAPLDSALLTESSVRFRIFFGSDGSVQDEGFAFDDFVIASPPAFPLDSAYEACGDSIMVIDAGSAWSSVTWYSIDSLTTDTANVDTIKWSGDYLVTVTDSLGLCAMDTINVKLFPNYITPDLGPDTTICIGDSMQYFVGFDSSMSYMWSTGSMVDSAYLSTGLSFVTTMDTSGACAITDSVLLSNPVEFASLGADSSFCIGDAYTLFSGVTGANSYNWSTGDTVSTINVSATGTYSVNIVDIFGCFSSDTVDITVNALPVVSISGAPVTDTICENHDVTLDGGAGFTSYSWSTGGSSQMETVSGSALGAGNAMVVLTAVDGNGCANQDTITFFVDPCLGIEDWLNESLTVFPNPSTGKFYYEFNTNVSGTTIIVRDISGKTIIDMQEARINGEIDLTSFDKGIYVMTIVRNNQTSSIRLIKQ